MTVKELLQEVKTLGFAEYIKLDDSFVCAANRAMRALFPERPVSREAKLFALECTPKTRHGALTHEAGATLCLPLTGCAYSMRLFGRGRYTVTDKNGKRTVDFDSRGELFRDFISGECEICFSGEYSYCIYALSSYSTVFGSKTSDIPDGGGKARLDISELYPDFLCFTSPVRDENGKIIEHAEMNGSIITLPEGFSGEVSVSYARAPRGINALDSSAEIDIPEALRAALPLLIAYYMLLEEEPESAAEYLSRYRESLAAIDKISYEGTVFGYTDTNGWA